MPNTYINVELTLENYNNIYRGFIKVACKLVAPNTEKQMLSSVQTLFKRSV